MPDSTCPQCDKKIEPDQSFCSNCGQQLEDVCIQCGEPTEPDDHFCSNCGFELREDASTGAEKQPSDKSDNEPGQSSSKAPSLYGSEGDSSTVGSSNVRESKQTENGKHRGFFGRLKWLPFLSIGCFGSFASGVVGVALGYLYFGLRISLASPEEMKEINQCQLNVACGGIIPAGGSNVMIVSAFIFLGFFLFFTKSAWFEEP